MSPSRATGSRWFGWVVSTLLLLGLLSCLVLLIKLIPDLQLDLHFGGGVIFLLFCCYAVATILSAIMWRNLVKTSAGVLVSWREALAGIAALLLGKYLPGKIAGLAGRAITISPKTGLGSASVIVAVEQAYILSGLIIFSATSALLLPIELNRFSVLVAAAAAVALAAIFAPLLGQFFIRVKLAEKRYLSDLGVVLRNLSPTASLKLLLLAVIVSALVCMPAWFLADILSIELKPDTRFLLVAAYGVSILGGMITVILPGGIGAREGIFILTTQTVLTLDVAIAAAALLRLINVAADMAIGVLGLAAWRYSHERS